MNIAQTTPPEPDDKDMLTVLVAALAQAEANEVAAKADVTRKQSIVDQAKEVAGHYRDALAVATQTANRAKVVDAKAKEHARRDAQAEAEAADRELAAAETDLERARTGLQAATDAVAAAKRVVALEQVRAEFYDMLADAEMAFAKYLKLLGAMPVLGEAIPPGDWMKLDRLWPSPSELNMALPETELTLADLPKVGEVPPKMVRAGEARDRVDMATAWWRRKLATMKAADFEGDAE